MSWQTPEDLSADEIAVLLGYANAAAMVAAIANSVFGAVPLTVGSDSGDAAAHLYASNSPSAGEVILNAPSYLSLQIAGATVAYLSNAINLLVSNVQRTADNTQLNLCGGSGAAQSNGAIAILYGNTRSGAEGWASYYTGSAAGAKHSFFDKNGAEQLRVDENGAWAKAYYSLQSGLDIYGGPNGTEGLIRIGNTLSVGTVGTHVDPGTGRGYFHNGLQFGDASYMQAPLSTRAASTAIALCPVATGDTAKVEISETTIADCLAFVDAAGTVTLYDKLGGTVSASIVNSSSPSATEYGVYISAGVLYFKGGSSYAGKMASFSKIGKA